MKLTNEFSIMSRTRESIEVNSVYLTPIMWNTKLRKEEGKEEQKQYSKYTVCAYVTMR